MSIASSRISGTSLMRACGFHLDNIPPASSWKRGQGTRERKLKATTGPTSSREDLPTPIPPPLLSQGSGISFHRRIKSSTVEFTGLRWRGGGQLRRKRCFKKYIIWERVPIKIITLGSSDGERNDSGGQFFAYAEFATKYTILLGNFEP